MIHLVDGGFGLCSLSPHRVRPRLLPPKRPPKACPQNAIDVRGYADFAPLGHSVRVLREEEKGTISWKIKFRDGRERNFESPIRTTPWGSIKSPSDYEAPSQDAFKTQELAHEPESLNVERLPVLTPAKPKQGAV